MITRVRIAGMSCQHCVRAVFTALTPVEGITSADVSIGPATIEHVGCTTMVRPGEAVDEAGYALEEATWGRPRVTPARCRERAADLRLVRCGALGLLRRARRLSSRRGGRAMTPAPHNPEQ